MTLKELQEDYGKTNVKQLGNKVIAIDLQYKTVKGYEIKNYTGIAPNEIGEVYGYTDFDNTGFNFDRAYDLIFGNPIYNI